MLIEDDAKILLCVVCTYLIEGRLLDGHVLHVAELVEHFVEVLLSDQLVDLCRRGITSSSSIRHYDGDTSSGALLLTLVVIKRTYTELIICSSTF